MNKCIEIAFMCSVIIILIISTIFYSLGYLGERVLYQSFIQLSVQGATVEIFLDVFHSEGRTQLCRTIALRKLGEEHLCQDSSALDFIVG